jgi:hypothetical protein
VAKSVNRVPFVAPNSAFGEARGESMPQQWGYDA